MICKRSVVFPVNDICPLLLSAVKQTIPALHRKLRHDDAINLIRNQIGNLNPVVSSLTSFSHTPELIWIETIMIWTFLIFTPVYTKKVTGQMIDETP